MQKEIEVIRGIIETLRAELFLHAPTEMFINKMIVEKDNVPCYEVTRTFMNGVAHHFLDHNWGFIKLKFIRDNEVLVTISDNDTKVERNFTIDL